MKRLGETPEAFRRNVDGISMLHQRCRTAAPFVILIFLFPFPVLLAMPMALPKDEHAVGIDSQGCGQ